jgi:hypothetical protein
MQCAFCRKPIRFWQSKEPLGPGPLPLYGQYEHTPCHEKRDEFIKENLAGLPAEHTRIHDETVGRLYREGTR